MRLGTAYVAIKTKTDELKPGLNRAQNTVSSATKGMAASFKRVNDSVFTLRNSVVGLAGAYGVGRLASSFFQTGMQVESLDKSLKSAVGSFEKAQKAQTFLRQESERLGLVFKNSIEDYKSIAAAAKGTTLEGQKTRDIYLGIAEAGTALKLTSDQLTGALKATEQMISKGTVQAEELRGQMGERIPGAFQIASRAMGVSTRELGKMLEQGKVVSEDFLPKFAAELRKTFGKDAVEAADSLQSSVNRMSNTWFKLQSTVMKSGVTDELAKSLSEVNTEMSDWVQNNQDLIKQRVPEYINSTKESVQDLYSIYSSIPDEIVGAAGYGIAGRVVFGGWGPAKIIAAVALINNALDGFGMGIGAPFKDASTLEKNFQAVYDALSGKKDWNTGELKLDVVADDLDAINTNAGEFEAQGSKAFQRVGESVYDFNKALKEVDTTLDDIDKKGMLDATVADAKNIEDIWLKRDQEKTEVAERGAIARYEIEEYYAEQAAELDQELTKQRAQYSTEYVDSWQWQAKEKYDVLSRAADAEIDLERSKSEEIEKFNQHMWENIQDHSADTINSLFDGGLESGKNFFDGLQDMAERTFSEMMAKELIINIKPFFEDIWEGINTSLNDGGVKKGDTGYVNYAGYAGSALAVYGMASSAESGSGQQTGTMAGAAAGGIGAYYGISAAAGPYGMAIGAIVGGILGSMTDDTPTWFDNYMDTLDELTRTVAANNRALEAQLNAVSSWTERFVAAEESKIEADQLQYSPNKGTPILHSAGETEAIIEKYNDGWTYWNQFQIARKDAEKTGTWNQDIFAEQDLLTTEQAAMYSNPGKGFPKHGVIEDEVIAWWNYYSDYQSEKYQEFENKMRLVLADIDQEIMQWSEVYGMGVPDAPGKSWEGIENVTYPETEKAEAMAKGEDKFNDMLAGLGEFSDKWEYGGEDWGAGLVDQRIEKVQEIRDAWLQSVEEEYDLKKQMMVDDIYGDINAIIDPTSELSTQLEGWEDKINSSIESLEKLGDAEEEINQIRTDGVAVAEELKNQYWENIQTSISGMLTTSNYANNLKSVIDNFDTWKQSSQETGASIARLTTLERQRSEVMDGLFTDLSNNYLGNNAGEIQQATENVDKEFAGIISYLISIGEASSEIAKYTELWAQATVATIKAPFASLQGQISDWKTGKERESWGAVQWQSEFDRLADAYYALNPATESYYDDALSIFTDQFSALQNIESITQAQLDSTNNSIATIDSTLFDLTSGSLAPAESIEGYQLRYGELLGTAQSELTEQALNDFIGFATGDWLTALGAYGHDYQDLTDTLSEDLQGLRSDFVTERDLLQAIVNNTDSTASIVATEATLSQLIAGMGSNQAAQPGYVNGSTGYLSAKEATSTSDTELYNKTIEGHFQAISVMTGESYGTILNSYLNAYRAPEVQQIDDPDAPLGFYYKFPDSYERSWTGLDGKLHGFSIDTINPIWTPQSIEDLNDQPNSLGGWERFNIRLFEKGGVASPMSNGINIAGEKWDELVLPMHDTPPHDAFMRSTGIDRVIDSQKVDPEAVGKAIARELAPLLMQGAKTSGVREQHIHLNIDGREVSRAVNNFVERNPEEMKNISNAMVN